MSHETVVPRLFTLTALTGREGAAEETEMVLGQDVRRRSLIVLGLTAVPAIVITSVVMPFLGVYALFVLAAAWGGFFFLIEGRQSEGMRLRAYQVLLDKKRNTNGLVFLCGKPVDPLRVTTYTVTAGDTPRTSRTPTMLRARR